MTPPRPQVLGVETTPGTKLQILEAISHHLRHETGLLHVVTANPEYVIFARRDPAFAKSIRSAGIVTVDGIGLWIAVRLLHPEVETERFTGVALVIKMAAMSAQTGVSLFLLGAGPRIANQAANRLREQYPHVHVAGTWDGGSPREVDDVESIRRVASSGTSILLVAYGAPAQIHWIERNQQALALAGVRIVVGIGGAFDYISGETPYAPAFIRRVGLEWLYRLLQEPWRWRRQLVLPVFAALVLREKWRSLWSGGVE